MLWVKWSTVSNFWTLASFPCGFSNFTTHKQLQLWMYKENRIKQQRQASIIPTKVAQWRIKSNYFGFVCASQYLSIQAGKLPVWHLAYLNEDKTNGLFFTSRMFKCYWTAWIKLAFCEGCDTKKHPWEHWKRVFFRCCFFIIKFLLNV